MALESEDQHLSPDPLRKIRDALARWSAIHRVRFGGVVGKVAYISISCIIACAYIIGRNARDPYTLALVVVLLFFAWGIIKKIFTFAQANPELATLEGAEILRWQQQSLAAKGLLSPPQSEPVVGRIAAVGPSGDAS